MALDVHAGGCRCGAVRYEVTGRPTRSLWCCCASCRGHSGAPAVAWAAFARDSFRVTKGAPATYASSEQGRRTFCPACGMALTYVNPAYDQRGLDFGDRIAIATVSFDDIEAFPPTAVFHEEELPRWLDARDLLGPHSDEEEE